MSDFLLHYYFPHLEGSQMMFMLVRADNLEQAQTKLREYCAKYMPGSGPVIGNSTLS